MYVNEVMTSHAEWISPHSTVRLAAERMKVLDVGSLPVGNEKGLIGMITDRDITIRAVAEGLDPGEIPVEQIMTTGVEFCFEDDTVRKAAAQMEECQIRRLPVLDRNRNLVGILALGDIAVRNQDDAISGEALEQISRPNPLGV